MAELADIQNEFLRKEVEEYVEREDERQRIIDLYAATTPAMQEIAAAIVDGRHLDTDQLTKFVRETLSMP